ncbi:MAG: 3,5-nucleoside bisphosphate phosphatase, partial [Actinomycetota bacterium]|nr:3,5-nucleoside bisphosphate phosphatase [Actinomycetota bacterium]
MDVVALTDHDTTGGWEAAAAALPPGLTLVPGAELSCRVGRTSLHLLAYLFDPAEPVFAAERARVRDSRVHRGRRMVELLAGDGHPVTWEEVLGYAAGGTVGRPHVGQALIRHGLVSTMDEAFTPDWLATGGRYWAPKLETEAADAVRL